MNLNRASHNVLIVDDEQDVCFLLKSMLMANGIKASACFDVTSCLRIVPNANLSHIILDITLPDGSGLDLLPKVKSMVPKAKIYMHSAQDTAENRKLANELGANGFLKKPIDREQLMELFR